MKKIIMAVIAVLSFSMAYAQTPTVRVTNNTNCRILFTANLYNNGSCTAYSSSAVTVAPMSVSTLYGFGSFTWTPSSPPSSASFRYIKYSAANTSNNVCQNGAYPFTTCPGTNTVGDGICAPTTSCIEISANCALCDIGTTVTATFTPLVAGNAILTFN